MFNRKDASAEIAESMIDNFISNIKKEAKSNEELLEIIAKIKSDPATKNLSSKKMIENLKHKGWVFNADDFNSSDDHQPECQCFMCKSVDLNDAALEDTVEI
jgi:aspartyl/asparaginyl-tRNA synthetase